MFDNKIETEKINRTEIENVENQKEEFRFVGNQRRVPGMNLFSFNRKTKEVKRIVPQKTLFLGANGTMERAKVVAEHDCIYGQALNIKSFTRKLVKYGFATADELVFSRS